MSDIRERKSMEDELERLASFPILNPHPIAEVDLDGNVHYLNPAAEQLFPDLRESGVHHPWLAEWEWVANELRGSETKTHVRALPVGERCYLQEMYFVPSAQVIRIYGLDITARKQAEKAFKIAYEGLEQRVAERTSELQAANRFQMEQSRHLDAFFKLSITPLVLLDRDFNFIRVNEAYARACQKLADDFPGHNHFEFYPSDAKVIFEDVLRTKQSFKVIARPFVFPDHPDWGVTYWDWTLTPILDEKGEVEMFVFALEDVTVRKRAELELEQYREHLEDLVRERTQKLEATNAQLLEEIAERSHAEEAVREVRDYLENLIDFANAPIIVWDSGFRITRFNHAFEKLTGLKASDVLDKPLDVLFPESSKEDSLTHIRRTLSGERWEIVEIPILHTDGSVKTVLWNSANIYSKNGGKVVATIAQGHDITERKHMEMMLREAKDELEHNVQERTEQLETANEELRTENEEHLKLEEELRTARDAAEAAAHAKADFMANMSHEIRTPMNAVIGMTSILLEEPLTPEQKDYVETIRNSGNALLVLINDILDFSRLDREKAELEEQLFDLRAVVEEALDQVAPQAAEKGLNLAYIIAKDVPDTIYSDPARLRQVLLNLLNNAVKFTENGEVLLSVGQSPAGVRHEIRFSVQDTGIGIPQEKHEVIFEPFAQADTSLARNHDGAGLGLAITRKLVELMGGKIRVKSEPGKGSCFRFDIMARVLPEEPKKILTGEQPGLKGRSVLIIDDSKANRLILGKILHEWGIVPLVVGSVKEARNSGYLNYSQDYDAVILRGNPEDLELTALAGRMREKKKELPMILIAPIGTKPIEGFSAVLTLPIKPTQLFNTLVTLFAQAPVCEIISEDNQTEAGRLKILLAEDNATSQKVTLQMLKKLGCRADLAANGREAVEALKRQHYDLVLMDVKMPVINGWDATREIRRLWPDNGPKIIALTAYALAGDREKCMDAGMDSYIAKPVVLEDLKRILMEVQRI